MCVCVGGGIKGRGALWYVCVEVGGGVLVMMGMMGGKER